MITSNSCITLLLSGSCTSPFSICTIGMYYKMKKQDRSLVPREMNVGTRTLITFEAAADWRAEREAASTAPTEKARAKREQVA